jgi:NADH-quinone oxidoreductase subunit J
MTFQVVAFWAFAASLVGAGFAVVLGKNLFHSVLWLALALVSTAGIFLTLNAEFIAAVQVLLYAGGVVTVVVFAIVVTERLVGAGAIVSAGVLVLLLRAIGQAQIALPRPPPPADLTRQIGTSLLTQFVLPFELLAVLLLVGLLAASYFARPEE